MKKIAFYIIAILAIMMPITVLADNEPYVVLSDDNTKLTFFYDDQKASRNGLAVNRNNWSSYKEQIISVVFDQTFANCETITNTAYWFWGLKNLTSITGLTNLKTSNVVDMKGMFGGCSELKSIDVSGFNTRKVTDMTSMFFGCRCLTSLDVSGFNTANVKNMGWVFANCSSLTSLDVSGFKTDNVTDMSLLFNGCSSLTSLDVSGFNTANVNNMGSLFFGCSGLTSLDVSGFNTEKVTRMSQMFGDCSGLTSLDVSGFNTENVTDMFSLFAGCSGLTTLNVSGFKTDNVTDMTQMFAGCSGLTSLDVSGFNTENVTNMHNMFRGCSCLTNLDVSGFKTDNVTDVFGLFAGCSGLTSLDVSGFNTENVTDMGHLFLDCSGLTSLDVSGFSTSKVTDMSKMFSGCRGLKSLELSGFKTDKVTNMSSMFEDCYGLKSLDVGMFNTENVTNMSFMFFDCSGFNSLDISEFKTDKVTDMSSMFGNCLRLETIYVSSAWSTMNVIKSGNMFYQCLKLVGGMGTKCDIYHIDHTYAHIDEGTSNPGYFTLIGTFRLYISSTGNGSVIYDINTIRNQTTIFTVEAGSSVTISINPDDGYSVKNVTEDGKDVTSSILQNQYKSKIISANTTIEVLFEIITEISVGGIKYNVVSAKNKTIKVANGNYGLCVDVPDSVSAYGKKWSVIGAEADAFDNASELAAIIWNPEIKFEEKLSNPNLLLYVKSAEYAPENINNIIVNNIAKSITLTDAEGGNNFYCPQEFTAEKITYVHNYSMKTGYNTCQGWESIVLPFDVSMVYNDLGTELVPYSLWKFGDNKRPFWLYSLDDKGWSSESAMKANTPYIISMPNNDNYDATYNLSGDIVFSASNVKVQASDNLTSRKYGNRELVPNYQNKEKSSEIFALNVNNLWDKYTESDPLEGSTFIRNLRQIRPFEAYMTIGNNSTTRSISIFGDGEATGIVNLPMINNGNNGNIKVYTLSGVLVKQGTDESVTEGLPKGIYIINNKKVVVE